MKVDDGRGLPIFTGERTDSEKEKARVVKMESLSLLTSGSLLTSLLIPI